MKRKRHTPEQIIRKLRTAEQLLNQGQSVADVCRAGYSGFLGSVIFFTFNGLGLSKVCFVGVGRDDSRSLPAPPRALCAI